MNVDGKHYRTIWVKDEKTIQIIDQRNLPHEFIIEDLKTVEDAARAITDMHVRGAPLIGATAAYGMYLAAVNGEDIEKAAETLRKTRPTAIDLNWAVDNQLEIIKNKDDKTKILLENAKKIEDESAEMCRMIGEHGVKIIEEIAKRKKEEGKDETVNILTHCNAGWLACVDYGTATSPMYAAHDKGIKVHIWVDETRPRNQGARLTAWELGKHGVPHTVIADNVGGHLMQHGLVDMVITGTDRTTYTGDVANKIGTYLKALAAYDNLIPFYVALPSSTFDWSIRDGVKEIPIEQRGNEEVKYARGFCEDKVKEVLLTPKDSNAANYAFDVTPSRLVTALITERGVCVPHEDCVKKLYPEKFK
ncbi:S-methyl-5-thioribose-1-phosphate isomerase [Candidatus Aenigmatarchaeota archaeon]